MVNVTFLHILAYYAAVCLHFQVNVTFLEFHLEDHNDHCHDWLQIHDGRDSTAHLIGRFCGANNPPNFVSTTNKVYMWFDSDGMTLVFFSYLFT